MENNLLSLNSRGIFPGPFEQREKFFKRAIAAKKVTSQENLRLTQEIFSAFPDWVNIHCAGHGLLPWEGAATWIEENAEGIREASVQVKSSFVTRLYPQEEIIAHEMVHAMRLMFEERRFEEILAFRTSKNCFRRYFGPLFTHPRETKGFVVCMLSSWLFYWTEFIFDFSLGANYLIWFPLLVLGWGIWRLSRSQKIFSLALNHLEKAIKEPEKSLAVALRLSDREIEQFAKNSPEEILAFASKEKATSLRWKQLFSSYFKREFWITAL
jgi:hypothetical protein